MNLQNIINERKEGRGREGRREGGRAGKRVWNFVTMKFGGYHKNQLEICFDSTKIMSRKVLERQLAHLNNIFHLKI